MTSLLVSASLNASRTHFIAVSKSTISPLRTPRDGACPTPKIFVVPSILLSPTTTQILDVPISNPTIKSLLAISFLLFWFPLVKRLRSVLIFFHRSLRQGFHHRRMHRNRFHDSRRLCRIDRVIDHFARRLHESDGNIPLHQQVDRFDVAFRIISIDEKLLESLNLALEMIEAESDA